MRRLLTNRYVAPAIPPRETVLLTLWFVGLTMIRGWGWLTAVPSSASDQLLAAPLGLTFWGWCLLLGGALVPFSIIVVKNHTLVWASHCLLASIYFGVGVAVSPLVFTSMSGWQNLVPPLGGMVWHVVLLRLMGPVPKTRRTRDAD